MTKDFLVNFLTDSFGNANTFLSLSTLFLPAPYGNANTCLSLPTLFSQLLHNHQHFSKLVNTFLTHQAREIYFSNFPAKIRYFTHIGPQRGL